MSEQVSEFHISGAHVATYRVRLEIAPRIGCAQVSIEYFNGEFFVGVVYVKDYYQTDAYSRAYEDYKIRCDYYRRIADFGE